MYSDSPLVTSTYTLSGTGSNGCSSSTTALIYVDICEDIRTENILQHVSVYPNPGEGLYKIRSEGTSPLTLTLSDLRGQELQRIEQENGSAEINLSHYPNGVYILKIERAAQSSTMKLVKMTVH